MPYDGSGNYSLVYNFTTEAGAPPIEIAKLDGQFDDIRQALSSVLLRNGTSLPTAAMPWNGQRLTGLGAAAAGTDALNRDTADGRYARPDQPVILTDRLTLSHINPWLRLFETDAAANEKYYSVESSGGALSWRAYADDLASSNAFMTVDRTGIVVDSLALAATLITLNGVNITDYARLSQINTFTAVTNKFSNAAGVNIIFVQGGAAANNGKWDILCSAEQFNLRALNDAENAAASFMVVDRTANVIDSIAFTATVFTVNGQTVWTAGNDGAASGLDSDLLDGQHGAFYRDAANLNAGTIPDARFPATLPAASGTNLTALNASQLTSGTVNNARLPTTVLAMLFSDRVSLGSVTSPGALAADQNDYAPGIGNSNVLRLTASAPINITGLAGMNGGQMLLLINVGASTITLANESAASGAANRFAFSGASLSLQQNEAAFLWYDATSSRVRVLIAS